MADTIFSQMKGLLGRKELPHHEVLWIKAGGTIHTWFMNFPIDIVFVDKNLCVRAIHKNVKPWRIVFPTWKAKSVFEFTGGKLHDSSITLGDQLYVGD